MTSVNRALRIGIVVDGSIFEERLLRRRSTVTVGQSTRNVFTIPVDELPMRTVLFNVDHGNYRLELERGYDGRIHIDGELHTVADLLAGSERISLPLPDGSRGKIQMGSVTVLFQFVTAPPLQPRPQLPPALRQGLLDRIDPALATVLAISLLTHLAIIIVAKQYDPPRSRYERIYTDTFDPTARFASARTPLRIPEQAPGVSTRPAPKTPEPARPAPRAHHRPRQSAPAPSGGDLTAEAVRQRVTRRVNNLFSETEAAAGRRGGMSHKRPGQDIGKVAEEIKRRGDRVELAENDRGPRKRSGRRRIGTADRPKVDAPGKTTRPSSEEKVPESVVLVPRKPRSPSKTSLTPKMVRDKIVRVYMRQLERCHRLILGKQPGAGGRVTISFTVSASGRATGASANGFNSTVDRCIAARANHWRFPKPRDGGEAVSQAFSLTLQLRPR
jgi:hypothetical protein